jgi:hypothetical protein
MGAHLEAHQENKGKGGVDLNGQRDMKGKAAAFMSASAGLGVGVVKGVAPHWCIWSAVIGHLIGLIMFFGD